MPCRRTTPNHRSPRCWSHFGCHFVVVLARSGYHFGTISGSIGDHFGSFWFILVPFAVILGLLWNPLGHVGLFWGHFGTNQDEFEVAFGVIFVPAWDILGSFWFQIGVIFWTTVWSFWGISVPLGIFEPFWNYFGTILGSFRDHPGSFWGHFWCSVWVPSIPFWGHFGMFGVILGQFDTIFGIIFWYHLRYFWNHFGVILACLVSFWWSIQHVWGHFWLFWVI